MLRGDCCSELLEARGSAPLLQLLQSLGGWPVLEPAWKEDKFDWLHLMAELRLFNNDILITEWVGPDVKNSDQYVIQLDQTGLGLPARYDVMCPPTLLAQCYQLETYTNNLATQLT